MSISRKLGEISKAHDGFWRNGLLFFRFASILIGLGIIAAITILRWHPFAESDTPTNFVKRIDKPVPAYQLNPGEGISFPVLTSDTSVKLVTRQIYRQKPIYENTRDFTYALRIKISSRNATYNHQRDFYESTNHFSPSAEHEPKYSETISEGFNQLWLSNVRLTTIQLGPELAEGGEVQISLHDSTYPILIQAYRRTNSSSNQSNIKNLSPYSRSFYSISQRLQIDSLYELSPKDYQKALRHLWMYVEGRPIGNHKLTSLRIHPSQPSDRSPASDQAAIAIPAGKSMSINLMGPLQVDLDVLGKSTSTTLQIETLHADTRLEGEMMLQPIRLQSNQSHSLDFPEGTQTLYLHNPNRDRIYLIVSAKSQDFVPFNHNKATHDLQGSEIVFLQPVLQKFNSYLISPRDQNHLDLTTLGFSDRDLIRMEVRAILASELDSTVRSFETAFIDGFERVRSRQNAFFRPRASRFESYQTSTLKPDDFISEAATFFIQPTQQTEKIRITSKSELVLRFFHEQSSLPDKPSPYPPHSADRRWRYIQAGNDSRIPIRPDQNPSTSNQRVRIIAQTRLEPKAVHTRDPNKPAHWQTLPPIHTARQQVLFEQVDSTREIAKQTASLWCRCTVGKSTYLSLPPDPGNPRKSFIEAIVHIPEPTELGGRLIWSFKRNKLPGRRPITRVETHRIRSLTERQGSFDIEYQDASMPKPPAIWVRQHITNVSQVNNPGCPLYKAFNVMQIQPGEKIVFPFHKSEKIESVIRIGLYAQHPVDMSILLDNGGPKRIRNTLLPSRTLGLKRAQPDWRSVQTHAWTMISADKQLRATRGVLMYIRNDLSPGMHHLALINKGKTTFWARASQKFVVSKPGHIDTIQILKRQGG